MITYNHEKYISEAIESILKQRTGFNIEIVIGEDCSTDQTRSVISKFANSNPGKIKPLFRNKNMGIIANFQNTIDNCTGKYIAICEGDDYWTDPLKLQKQVDFLENNPDFSGCAHQTNKIFFDPDETSRLFKENTKDIIGVYDLLETRLFHTASFIYRSQITKDNPLPINITAGDRALFLLVASKGKIKYFDDVMGVYRKHIGGISTWVTCRMMEKDLNIIKWIRKINPAFPYRKYSQFIHYTIMAYPAYISKIKIVEHYLKYVYFSMNELPFNSRKLKQFTFVQLPEIWKKSNKPNA
jgi:glycosyltransferase involved in cell wall biosynthesis